MKLPVPTIPTINLSILDTHLQRCWGFRGFLQIHAQMVASGFINDAFAASRLLDFCCRSHSVDLGYSRRLLRGLDDPNGFSWNRVMKACVGRNAPELALPLYRSMLRKGSSPDNYTYPILAQACSARSCEGEGKQVHAHVLEMGFASDVYVVNTLISMYSLWRNVSDARHLFDESPVLDMVSWNTMLGAYVEVGDVEQAVWVFDRMPERSTIASNSLIALFGWKNRVGDARRLFDGMHRKDAVSWTAIISCYEQNSLYEEALETFSLMNCSGIPADEVAMISALAACSRLVDVRQGAVLHGLAGKSGHEPYVNLQNALINMYSSCGDMSMARKLFDVAKHLDQVSWNTMISGCVKSGLVDDARVFFDHMPRKDTVSWSTMISGYVQHDRFTESLALFHEMQLGSIRPDETMLVSVLSACARISSLEQGRWVHTYIKKNDYEVDIILGTTLVDMYLKCGCVRDAVEIFNVMEQRGVSTWNALIMGLAMNGLVADSLDKFEEMKKSRVVPNEITYLAILGACRHVGLVSEGRKHFSSMIREHKIAPNIQHYGCMVDLLGRAGLLEEAEELIESMPMDPDVATWGALLGACRKHGDFTRGERIGTKLIKLEPRHDGFHVLLSNIYASKGKWNDANGIREIMKEHGVLKVPGCSLIEVNGVVHEFLASDESHPQIKQIEKMIDEISRRLKMKGYKPDVGEVTLDIDEEEKETSLYRHSEKLAMAFGLINTCSPTPIRIIKNLRICHDCHSIAKLISKTFEREIVIRDRRRFHHFKEGICSCADYW